MTHGWTNIIACRTVIEEMQQLLPSGMESLPRESRLLPPPSRPDRLQKCSLRPLPSENSPSKHQRPDLVVGPAVLAPRAGLELDAKYYTNDVIEYLEAKGVGWAICVDKGLSVMEAIGGISQGDWRPFRAEDGIMTDREISETVHVTNKGKSAFRLVVLRRKDRQADFFGGSYFYHCIATGMSDQSAEEVVWRYNKRAQIENHIDFADREGYNRYLTAVELY